MGDLVGDIRWNLGGGFNLIISLEEKHRGLIPLDNESEAFKEIITSLHLIDLDFMVGIFTWSNKRSISHQISYKLDHFLISKPLMLYGLIMKAYIL